MTAIAVAANPFFRAIFDVVVIKLKDALSLFLNKF